MALPAQKPDIIILDMDDTILDHGPLVTAAFNKAFEGASKAIKSKLQQHLLELLERLHDVNSILSSLSSDAWDKHRSLRGINIDEAFGNAAQENWKSSRLYPEAAAFLTACKAAGIECHLVTASPPSYMRDIMAVNDAAGYFFSMNSTRAGLGRHKIDIYKEIAAAYKDRHGRSAIVWLIGDQETDFPGRRELERDPGFTPAMIAFSSKSHAYKQHPWKDTDMHYVFDGYHEALEHVQKMSM